MRFDLTKYDLTVGIVHPYFHEPTIKGMDYHIYEGAIGNNRFQYFKVSKKSNAGKLCKQFVEKYYKKNEHRFNFFEDVEKLIKTCKTDAIEQLTGLDAYLKYWNDCLTENDKLLNNIYSIQHFEALKEWFNLSLQKQILKNEHQYFSEEIKRADIEQYQESITNDVSTFLKQSERSVERKFSAITKMQANELIKFYNWLTTEKFNSENIFCNVPFISELLNKHINISENILDVFYGLARQPQSHNEVPNYGGKLNHYNSPYHINIYGAYFLNSMWELLNYKVQNVNDENGYFKEWEKKKVFEALKDYAKGFQNGFDNFLIDIIDDKNSLTNSEKIRLQKIKDYVLNPNNLGGLSETFNKGNENIFCEWYNDGNKAGCYYKAWYLILDNHLAFAPLFEKSTLENIQYSNNDIVTKTFNELKNIFNSDEDCLKVITAINSYFETGKSNINKPIFVKNGNIKNLAYAMGEIWRSKKNDIITYEYLLLYKKIFSIFKNHEISKNVFSNNLYKYSISKT